MDQLTSTDQREAVETFRQSLQSIRSKTASPRSPQARVATGEPCSILLGQAVPVWIADYVLPDYGTGAVMGVPAHDSRDLPLPSNTTSPSPRWWNWTES